MIINAKNEILKVVEKENLQILKIDCFNADYICLIGLEESEKDFFKDVHKNAKQYQSIEELDFEYDTDDFDFLHGIVYCNDKKSKEPVWLCRICNEHTAWWEVNRIPEFYKPKTECKCGKEYTSKKLELSEKLQKLPYLATEECGEESLHIASDCYAYIPTLAKYEEEWSIEWIHHSESDTIKTITGSTPEEAVSKAYNWCIEKGFIKL